MHFISILKFLDDLDNLFFYRTDLIFHALDPDSNEIVDFDIFIDNLNVELYFDAVQECDPQEITVRHNEKQIKLALQWVDCYYI